MFNDAKPQEEVLGAAADFLVEVGVARVLEVLLVVGAVGVVQEAAQRSFSSPIGIQASSSQKVKSSCSSPKISSLASLSMEKSA